MKKIIPVVLCVFAIAGFTVFLFDINTTTKQCVDYKCQNINIPLGLKIIDLFDRHYNYRRLVKGMLKSSYTEEERVMQIFKWVHANIKKVPPGFPVVDDHVWNIVIRGYGQDDQHQDVFTTLCNYAGPAAFFVYLHKNKNEEKCFSLVKLKRGWALFDVYNGVYFKNKEGQIASVDDLLEREWRSVNWTGDPVAYDYAEFFRDLTSVNYNEWRFSRSAIQSPLRRYFYWGRFRK